MPSITTITAAKSYTAADSKGLIANLTLPLTSVGSSREFTVTYPTAVPTPFAVRLERGTVGRELLPDANASGGTKDTTTFAGRELQFEAVPAGATTSLTCTIAALSSAATDSWAVRLSAAAPVAYSLTTTGSVARIMCDPAAGFTVPAQPGLPADTVLEQTQVTLTAEPYSPSGAPTLVVVTATPPAIHHRWSASVPLSGWPVCATVGNTAIFTAPAAASSQPQPIQITEQVFYEGSCPSNVGLLNRSVTKTVTVQPRAPIQIGVRSTVGVDTWVRT